MLISLAGLYSERRETCALFVHACVGVGVGRCVYV